MSLNMSPVCASTTDKCELKIVQIVREVGGHGGSSGVATSLQTEFSRLGIENELISWRDDGRPWRSRLVGKFVLFFDVVAFSIVGTLMALRRRRPGTVVIVHNEALAGDIYVEHGLHKAVVAENRRMLLRNPIHPFLLAREEMRHLLGHYRRIVVLSSYAEDVLRTYYPTVPPEKFARIANGIDLSRFRAGAVPEKGGAFRLIFIGHEFERKRLNTVIAALQRLPANVVLSVVGGSEDEISASRALASRLGVEPRVSFLGRRRDVPDLLALQDFLVLPARYESWGLVVIEAMAAGVPVAMTAVGCAREVIVEGETGLIVEDDPADIAEKLGPYALHPDRLAPMREAARAMAARFSWESIARQYIDLAEEVRLERNR